MAGLHLCGTRPRAPLWGFGHHVGGGQPLRPIFALVVDVIDPEVPEACEQIAIESAADTQSGATRSNSQMIDNAAGLKTAKPIDLGTRPDDRQWPSCEWI